jgi:hypothetical protein
MQTEVPIPYELQYPDQLLSISKNPRQAPQPFGTLQMSGARQIIDPQLIDELGTYRDFIKKYTGKAKGGEVDLEEEYKKANILEKKPEQGGAKIMERPNPYGLRAFETDTGYGGEMMPKTSGWAGEIPSLAKEGQVLTEVSLGGENGEPFYPMVFEGITPEQIEIVQDYEAGLREDDDPAVMAMKQLAKNKALTRMHMHQSPFKDVKMADGGSLAKTLAAPIEGYAKSAQFAKELAGKYYEGMKEDVSNLDWNAIRDIPGNIGADILGLPGDLAKLAFPYGTGVYAKGIEDQPSKLGSRRIKDELKDVGITSGKDYPFIEGTAEVFPGTAIKTVKSIPAAGKAIVKEAGRQIDTGTGLLGRNVVSPRDNIIPEVGGNFGVDFTRPSEEVIKSHKMDVMPGEQWHSWLQSNAPKAVKKELETSGTLDMLKGSKDKLTKQDVINHLWENEPRLRSKTYKPEQDHPYEVVNNADDNGYDVVDTHNGDRVLSSHSNQYDAYEAMQDFVSETHPQSKYVEYTLPGNWDEYREIVIQDKPKVWTKEKKFSTQHYPEATNPIAHLRVNHRNDVEGNPTLFIEELQSDWAQRGKKKGFGKEAEIRYDPGVEAYRAYDANGDMINLWNGKEYVVGMASKDAVKEVLKNTSYEKGIPHGPYVEDTKDWTALSIKQAIKEAIDNGKTQVAWTTGTQQAERYDLSKHLRTVYLRPTDKEGMFKLNAVDHNGENVVSKLIKEDEIEDHVGKDLANKLVNTKPIEAPPLTKEEDDLFQHYYNEGKQNLSSDDIAKFDELIKRRKDAEFDGVRRLQGLDIKVGGEGMKGYYDNIVPQVANDILKQLGSKEKVRPIKIKTKNFAESGGWTYKRLTDMDTGHVKVVDKDNNVAKLFDGPNREDNWSAAMRWQQENDPALFNEQMGFKITPEMVERIKAKGIPKHKSGGSVTKYDLEKEFKLNNIIEIPRRKHG